jgi:hypothetical protein
MGRPDSVVTNYSTMLLRDIFWLDEASARSRTVADRLGPSDFNMPWMNARADVLCADLLSADVAEVEREWSSVWEDALACHAWERWLISGRLAWVRAELELFQRRFDDAVTWARRALEMAGTGSRRKYEIAALTTLGKALIEMNSPVEAAEQLRIAIARSDDLGTPLMRWRTRAACGLAELRSPETAGRGEGRLRDAAAIIREVAASLHPERGARYLAAPEVVAVIDAAG